MKAVSYVTRFTEMKLQKVNQVLEVSCPWTPDNPIALTLAGWRSRAGRLQATETPSASSDSRQGSCCHQQGTLAGHWVTLLQQLPLTIWPRAAKVF